MKGKEIPQLKALSIGDNNSIKVGDKVRLIGVDSELDLKCIDTTINKYLKKRAESIYW